MCHSLVLPCALNILSLLLEISFFLLHLLNQILLTLKDTTPKLIIMSSIFYLIQIEVTSFITNTYPYNYISHAILK